MRLFKMSLTLQMAIATFFGILCGLFFGDLCTVFSPYGTAYVMLLKVTAIPYLIGAIIHGVGQLGISQAKLILKRGLIFISLVWFINIVTIYAITALFPQSNAQQIGGYVSSDIPQLNFAELLIPDNIFYDLSNNIVPAIVIFSVLIGIALMHLKEKQFIMTSMQNLVEALTRITSWIARITPFGTFMIIANQVGTIQLSTVKQVSTYVILYIIGTSLLIFWIFPRLTQMFTSIPSYQWIQQAFPILLLAYTTNIVIVCLPYIIELLKKEIQRIDPYNEKAQNQIQGTVSVVFNLPLGSLFITVFVFFISIFYTVPLGISSQVKLFVTTFLTSLGAVGLGSWINSLNFILDSLGLPLESVNLYLTTLPFTSGFQSMISVIEITFLSLLITFSCRNLLFIRWGKMIKQSIYTITPLILIFFGLKLFNPLPEIKNETKSIYELAISSTIPTTVHLSPQPSAPFEGDTLDHILETKVLRVGYHPLSAPFCFHNIDDNIVGFDIAFAYELAYDLGVQLEFFPLSYNNLPEELSSYQYDIAMSAITINEQRLKQVAFTHSYLSGSLAFVVPEKERKLFATVEGVQENSSIKIALLKGSSFERIAKDLFPEKEVLYLENYDQFQSFEDPLVALLWEEQEAIAWTLRHRYYRVVVPQPKMGYDTLGYAIRQDSSRFLHYLNQWLELKKTEGFTNKQTELWIKGKTKIAAPVEKRWSIIRNVLHWVD